MSNVAEIYEETKALKPIQRLELAELLLADLDKPDQQIDRLWAAEAQSRWDRWKAGEMPDKSYEEVMAKYIKR